MPRRRFLLSPRRFAPKRHAFALRAAGDRDPELSRIEARFWTRREALAIARSVIAAYPRCFAGHRLHALALGERNLAALAPLTRVIALAPSWSESWFMRAEMLMQLDRYQPAAVDLSTALRFDNGYYREPIFLLRAECYRRLGRFDRALADCDRVASPDCWFRFVAGRLSLCKEQIVDAIAREQATQRVPLPPEGQGSHLGVRHART